jgi:hypothetical protein
MAPPNLDSPFLGIAMTLGPFPQDLLPRSLRVVIGTGRNRNMHSRDAGPVDFSN